MRILPALLIVVAALVGCGGGKGDGDRSSASVQSNVLSVSAPWCCTFSTSQYGWTPQGESVDVWTSTGYIRTSQTGPMFSHKFTAANAWGGKITIDPAMPMEVGIYTGTITVSACSNETGSPCHHVPGSPKTIHVTYTVDGLSVTPAQLTFSSAGPATQTATIASIYTPRAPYGAYTWQTIYSPSVSNWLQVRPSSGTPDLAGGPQTLEFTANAAGLPVGVYSATVTFNIRNSYAIFNAPLTVTMLVGDPSANFVAPYVVQAGVAGNVIVRGRGFSSLNPDGLSVQFSSSAAITAAIVSDTEIRATYPPLTAGSYSISVSSGATSVPSRAGLKLVAVDPPTFPLHTIARPASAGRPEHLIYDAERQALLFTDPTNNRILRYALADDGSATADTTSRVGAIALSPDGTQLIRVGPDVGLFHLDPVTLVADTTRPQGAFGAFAFANDGGAVSGCFWSTGMMLCRYDMSAQAFTPLSSQWSMPGRPIFASADGGTLLLPYAGNYALDSRVYVYDANTGALTPRPVTTTGFRALSMSRDASRVIIADMPAMSIVQATVYDAAFNVLGTLPNDSLPFVLSPDGNLAYAYSGADGRVRKFDVSTPGAVSEVGSGSTVAPANTEMSEMTISPDGGTLFFAGQTSVVIAPAP